MIPLDAEPRLRRAVRLRYDRVRDRWLLLAPERGFVLNATGLAVVQAFAPGRTLGAIAAGLAGAHPEPGVAADVVAFVGALFARGLCEAAR